MLLHLAESQKVENERLANTLSNTYRESGAQFADEVSGAIENSLKSPLDKIAGAVQTASGDQSGMVQNMLQDVLTAFMAKLDTTFGQQFTNLNEMMGQTVRAIQTMQSGFSALLQDMRQVSDDSRQGSAQLIEQLLSEMKSGQQAMQASMNDMLTSLQSSVAKIGAEGEGAGERMAQQLEKMFADSEAREKLRQNTCLPLLKLYRIQCSRDRAPRWKKWPPLLKRLVNSWVACLARSIKANSRSPQTSRQISNRCMSRRSA